MFYSEKDKRTHKRLPSQSTARFAAQSSLFVPVRYQQATTDKALVVTPGVGESTLLTSLLETAGYVPQIFEHPASVLASIPEEEYALAFIDVDLPDMNGLDLAQRLQDKGCLRDFVFMSANGSYDYAIRAIKLGASDYLKKPFGEVEIQELLTRLRNKHNSLRLEYLAEQKHQSLIQNIPLLVFTLQRDLSVDFVNPASETMLGFSSEEVLRTEQWLLKRVHPNDVEKVRSAFASSFAMGKPFSLECRLLHKRETIVHGILRSVPEISYSQGQDPASLQRMEGIFVDISDRVFLEKALVQNEKLKTLGAISAEVAHEVRNPLMSIAGFARRLEKKSPDTMEASIILRESMRLEKLLNRIRDYLRPMQSQLTECSVNDVLGENIRGFFQDMQNNGLWCEVDLEDQLPRVVADVDVLSQVIVNLLRSIMAMASSTNIFYVRTFESNRNIHVELKRSVSSDNTENAEEQLLPFNEEGQEKGLPLSYRLVREMGGVLSFMPEFGHMVFTLSLPIDSTVPAMKPSVHDKNLSVAADSCFDELTETMTQRSFQDQLERYLRICTKEKAPLSVVMIELDGFESFSRKVGRPTSSEHVSRVASLLSNTLSDPWQLLTRTGPCQFVAMLPQADKTAAKAMARALSHAVESMEFTDGEAGGAPPLFLCLGVATAVPSSQTQAQDLLSAAGRAMFQAQKNDCTHVHHVTLV